MNRPAFLKTQGCSDFGGAEFFSATAALVASFDCLASAPPCAVLRCLSAPGRLPEAPPLRRP